MAFKIKRACVLGAGVMGSQIAAHLAAAGVRTHLLDILSQKIPDAYAKDKKALKAIGKNIANARSIYALEQLKSLKPAPLMSKKFLANIIPGNFDDDMSVIADCDWVIEVVIEKLDIKRSIHAKISEFARPDVPVTTNTSGISLEDIVTELPVEYQSRFLGTHFFNPPRYMHLVEIIPHAQTDKKLVSELTNWISARLGKGIVFANDTVNFIANRVGVFSTQSLLKHSAELGINFETADALTGALVGRAKSATFRTMDVVGLDVFAAVAANTFNRATNDPYKDWHKSPEWMVDLIKAGNLGQKTVKKGGVYKKTRGAKGTEILVYEPSTKDYRAQNVTKPQWLKEAKSQKDLAKRLNFIISQEDNAAQLIWRNLRDVFAYCAIHLNEISSGSPKSVDDAICFGFNWEFGPFALWQEMGVEHVVKKMLADKVELPEWINSETLFYKENPPTEQFISTTKSWLEIKEKPYEYYLPKRESKHDKRVVKSNASASLLDIGHGVACLSFHSKMNAIDVNITEMILHTASIVDKDFDALVIANEGKAFSAGANLNLFLEQIKAKKFDEIEYFIRQFQGALLMLKYAPFPTITCPYGLVLGGGCEVALHADRIVTSAETYAGLVEVGVGLIPAGGGTKELALRAYDLAAHGENVDPMPFLQREFLLIGMGKVSTSGYDAIDIGLFPDDTHVSLSRERQLDHAKHLALQMLHAGYVVPTPKINVKVVGDPGIQTFRMMLYNMCEGLQISKYDAFVGEKVATILCGGEVDGGSILSEQDFLNLERRVFIELCQQEKTAQRIEHMLKTGKALRN